MMKVGLLMIASFGVAAATNAAGVKFLASNKDKDGVVTLPSGLQYKVLRKGDGTDHPLVNSPCECHYEGRTAANYPDGPVFDSSYARGQPTTFAPNQVIGGWTEAMQLMVEGDKWEMCACSPDAFLSELCARPSHRVLRTPRAPLRTSKPLMTARPDAQVHSVGSRLWRPRPPAQDRRWRLPYLYDGDVSPKHTYRLVPSPWWSSLSV
jgi:FKBP-type peptidyl-prolyl cis-trans isomerase FklB